MYERKRGENEKMSYDDDGEGKKTPQRKE